MLRRVGATAANDRASRNLEGDCGVVGAIARPVLLTCGFAEIENGNRPAQVGVAFRARCAGGSADFNVVLLPPPARARPSACAPAVSSKHPSSPWGLRAAAEEAWRARWEVRARPARRAASGRQSCSFATPLTAEALRSWQWARRVGSQEGRLGR
jgi:hypothetical protein